MEEQFPDDYSCEGQKELDEIKRRSAELREKNARLVVAMNETNEEIKALNEKNKDTDNH